VLYKFCVRNNDMAKAANFNCLSARNRNRHAAQPQL